MGQISASYASPGLRQGLMLDDFPQAKYSFREGKGTEVGIPASMGANDDFCIATIEFPGTGKQPAVGYKALKSVDRPNGKGSHESDKWLVACSKALGRALKRAGYPDDLIDLKALVLWRQRAAEIAAIAAGADPARHAVSPVEMEKALDAAGVQDPEHAGPDEGDAPDRETEGERANEDQGAAESNARNTPENGSVPPSPETVKELRRKINELGDRSPQLTTWCRDKGWKVTRPSTEYEALEMIAHASKMLTDDEGRVDTSTGESLPDDVLDKQVKALGPEEWPVFVSFLADSGVELKEAGDFTAANLTPAQRANVVYWFNGGD